MRRDVLAAPERRGFSRAIEGFEVRTSRPASSIAQRLPRQVSGHGTTLDRLPDFLLEQGPQECTWGSNVKGPPRLAAPKLHEILASCRTTRAARHDTARRHQAAAPSSGRSSSDGPAFDHGCPAVLLPIHAFFLQPSRSISPPTSRMGPTRSAGRPCFSRMYPTSRARASQQRPRSR